MVLEIVDSKKTKEQVRLLRDLAISRQNKNDSVGFF